MKSIYKYTLRVDPHGIRCKMPKNAFITSAEMTEDGLQVWALVDLKAAVEKSAWRMFYVHKTGETLPDSIADCLHIKTIITRVVTQDGSYGNDMPEFRTLVDHLWEIDKRTHEALKKLNAKQG